MSPMEPRDGHRDGGRSGIRRCELTDPGESQANGDTAPARRWRMAAAKRLGRGEVLAAREPGSAGMTGMTCPGNGEILEKCCLDGRNLRMIKS